MYFNNVPKEKWPEMEATVRSLLVADLKVKPKEGQTEEQKIYSIAYNLVMGDKDNKQDH